MISLRNRGGVEWVMMKLPYKYHVLITYLMLVAFISFAACTSRDTTTESKLVDHLSLNHQFKVDSIVSIISKDTISLMNWLRLSGTTNDPYTRAAIYYQLGTYHQNNYSIQRAIDYHNLSLATAKESGNGIQEIRALNALGHDYKLLCTYNKSAEHYFKALVLLGQEKEDQEKGDTKKAQTERIKTLEGIGSLYLALNQTDEAMKFFNRSLNLATRFDQEDAIASNLINIGRVHEEKQEYDSAYTYYYKSLEHGINLNSVSNMGRSFERIGNIYRLKGDIESAVIYGTSAYQSLLGTSDKLNWLNACFSLTTLYITQGNFPDAIKLLNEGTATAKSLNLPGYQKQAHLLYSELYKQQGFATKALEERVLSEQFARDFQNEKNLNAILQSRLNYEHETKEVEKNNLIDQYQQKEKKARFARIGHLSIIIALLASIFLLIQNYRLRKRNNQAIVQLETHKSMLCARVSQEFKTPVGIIIGLTERIKEELLISKKSKSWVTFDILSRQTENLYTLIDEVTSIANLQGINNRANAKNGNVVTFLQYVYECFAIFAEAKRINYTFHSNVSEILTSYDPENLRVILHNLLGSAIKHCTENDEIRFHINRDRLNKIYSIEIIHNGKSVLPEGMEIGITLGEHLVRKMGGSMEVIKEPGRETIYSICFPLDELSDSRIEKPITIQKAPNAKSTIDLGSRKNSLPVGKPVILIAQENKYFSFYLLTLLEEKFHVILEKNGDNALKTAYEILPDLIVSDVILSRKNGFELCREVKRSSTIGHIPVLLITAMHSREERIKGFSSGADACMDRPLHESEFMAVIDQLLSSRKLIRDTYSRITGVKTNHSADQNGNKDHIDFLQRVTSTIYKEITNTDHIIEKISSEMCLSSSQLNRKIKAMTGMTTSNYILKTRLNRAKRQLVNSHKPIGDVAMECGFNDFAYFSRSFKKEFGITPTTFQRLPESV